MTEQLTNEKPTHLVVYDGDRFSGRFFVSVDKIDMNKVIEIEEFLEKRNNDKNVRIVFFKRLEE